MRERFIRAGPRGLRLCLCEWGPEAPRAPLAVILHGFADQGAAWSDVAERLVAGGWPASASGKWLHKLVVRNVEHDGAKMGGMSYRVPCKPVRPGQNVEERDMCIIESMPVKSLVTFPKSGVVHPLADELEVRGHAWAGERKVSAVHYSIDFGQTWKRARTAPPKNRLAWQRSPTHLSFAVAAGRCCCRATA